jgi:hypothetical protein
VANHLSLLGALWIVYSLFLLLAGVFLLFLGKVFIAFLLTQHPADAPPIFLLRPLLSVVGILVLGYGALGLAAGWGLLRRESWARLLAMIVGCIALIKVPFGTALGIYTLWVLISHNGEQEYAALSAQAGRG